MPFKEVIAAGVFLVREALRSPNYVVGQQGWTINRDGSAEFLNVTVRGTIVVGNPPGSAVVIEVNNVTQRAEIDFYSGGSLETDPGDIGAQVSNSPTANQPMLFITSNEMGFDSIDFRLGAPTNAGEYGFYFVNNSTSGTNGMFTIDGDLLTRLLNGTNLNVIGSTQHSLQIGGSSGINMAFGQQEIQQRNNGAVETLFLNRFGGTVATGGALSVGSTVNTGSDLIVGPTNSHNIQLVVSGGQTTIQGANNGVGNTLILNPNGTQVFTQGVHNAAGGFLSTNGNLTLSNGQVFAAQLNTNAGTAIGSHVIAASELRSSPPSGGSANCNLQTISGKERVRLATSSRRYKENIVNLDGYAVEQILALEPRRFQRNDERHPVTDEVMPFADDELHPTYAGFIAEEAKDLGLDHWVIYSQHWDEATQTDGPKFINGFAYDVFAAVAHQIVLREHQARIDRLEHELKELHHELEARPRPDQPA